MLANQYSSFFFQALSCPELLVDLSPVFAQVLRNVRDDLSRAWEMTAVRETGAMTPSSLFLLHLPPLMSFPSLPYVGVWSKLGDSEM